MTNGAKKSKKNFTFRMSIDLSSKIDREAEKLGLTKNSYITMILHKELMNK